MPKKSGKELYDYQKKAIEEIFQVIQQKKEYYNLVYQLPTGGGKTVIFSDIAKRYIQKNAKKVLILTHRIELCNQTSKMLAEFQVKSKVINSNVKELEDQKNYSCFVAMVETLKNRMEECLTLENIGLVIVDEAHYNSFRKLFRYFKNCFILGLTATPLSSNFKIPMNEIYDDILVGEPISYLVEQGFLAKANIYTYDVALGTLKIGIHGDYTVRSSDRLYMSAGMLEKLLYAYKKKSNNKKTLIFNNGISTSVSVYDFFKQQGLNIKHLDNTASKLERQRILKWFKKTPNAILTSVGILTAGFDEPSVETVILNRATKSITLYYQMIGRGSRIYKNKKEFNIIDLGNNSIRFGFWGTPLDWKKIFHAPLIYTERLLSDMEIESQFNYELPAEVKKRFKNTKDMSFDVESGYKNALKRGLKAKSVLDDSIEQHKKMCIENSNDVFEAREIALLLKDDIAERVKKYSKCIIQNTSNYVNWLEKEYKRKLNSKINQYFSEKLEN